MPPPGNGDRLQVVRNHATRHSSLVTPSGNCYKTRMAQLKIGFLGAGKMATALAKGFVNAKLVKANQIFAADPF